MKNRILLFTLLLTALPLSIFAQKQAISINSKKITVNKQTITPGWQLETLKSALGPAERVRDGYNITHTYDNAGIVLFESTSNKKGLGIATEIQIYFYVSASNEVTPKNTYRNDIKIDKLKANRNTSSAVMLKKLKNWKKTDSYLENSYRMSNGELYIYFQFSSDEQLLEKISIGKNKKQ